MATGLFRDGNWAQVRYEDKYDVPITRERYDEQGYLPLFEELLTKEEYDRATAGVRFGDDA